MYITGGVRGHAEALLFLASRSSKGVSNTLVGEVMEWFMEGGKIKKRRDKICISQYERHPTSPSPSEITSARYFHPEADKQVRS